MLQPLVSFMRQLLLDPVTISLGLACSRTGGSCVCSCASSEVANIKMYLHRRLPSSNHSELNIIVEESNSDFISESGPDAAVCSRCVSWSVISKCVVEGQPDQHGNAILFIYKVSHVERSLENGILVGCIHLGRPCCHACWVFSITGIYWSTDTPQLCVAFPYSCKMFQKRFIRQIYAIAVFVLFQSIEKRGSGAEIWKD